MEQGFVSPENQQRVRGMNAKSAIKA